MKSILPIQVKMDASILRQPPVNSVLPIGTWWNFDHFRGGKLIDQWEQKNVNMTEGINHLLNVVFHGDTPITTWYMLLFDDNYTPLITDTYAVPGFTESADYDEATRPEFVEAEATARVITNVASKATFTISATTTIYGAALVGGGTDGNTKSDAAGGGVLFCASKFATAKKCVDDDVLMAYCTITIADV
jgi:hypothetical protein